MIEGWPVPVATRIEGLRLDSRAVAAFDADDTLWDGDLGIGLLEWASAKKVLAGPGRGKGAFDRYRVLRQGDEEQGLKVCATDFAGLTPARVAELAEAHFRAAMAKRVFPAIRALFSYLAACGCPAWIVTASPRFAVLPGALALGVPPERVIGIELAVVDGVYTPRIEGPITWRAAKASSLLARAGRPPVLAAGNGSNDLELLASATDLAIAVNPSEGSRRDGGPSLARAAGERNWPVVRLAL